MRIALLSLVPLVFIVGVLAVARTLHRAAPSVGSCELGSCPSELTPGNAGGIYTYAVGSRISLYLDANNDPQALLRCTPSGVIGAAPGAPLADAPHYWARFEGLAPGACLLEDNNFSAKIVIVGAAQ